MNPSEHQIQVSLFKWAQLVQKKLPEVQKMFAIPNESYGGSPKDIMRGAKFKREGRKRGVPDIFLPVARKGKHGMFIEMKAKTGRVSEHQKDWLNSLEAEGYYCIICRSLDEAIIAIEDYLKLN